MVWHYIFFIIKINKWRIIFDLDFYFKKMK
jgi:hypothetical protein